MLPTDDLRRVLVQRTAAASEQARLQGGDVTESELSALDRLSRLIELDQKLTPSPPRRPWTFVVIMSLALSVLSALLFVRTTSTAIEFEIDATQVAFALPSEQILFENIELNSLTISGAARLRLPAAVNSLGSAVLGGPTPPLMLTALESGGQRGVIAISQVRPQGKAAIDLRLIEEGGHYLLSLRGGKTPIDVGIRGPIGIESATHEAVSVVFDAPQGVTIETNEEPLNLELSLRDASRAATIPQIPVVNPSFRRVDEYGDRELSILRTLSTVLGGRLFFESLGGKERSLRSGESLRFGRAEGEIRTLRLRPDRLTMSFHGRASGMTSGDGPERRSLMPTWLDLLRAQHGLELLWGSSLYISGIAMAVYRWWRG